MTLTREDVVQVVQSEIAPVNEKLRLLWKLIKGDNGEGMQIELKLMKKSVDSLNENVKMLLDKENTHRDKLQDCKLENVPKVQQALETSLRIDKRISEFISEMKEQRGQDKKEQKEKENQFGSWSWFRDKKIEPIWAAIVLYIAVELVKYIFVY